MCVCTAVKLFFNVHAIGVALGDDLAYVIFNM